MTQEAPAWAADPGLRHLRPRRAGAEGQIGGIGRFRRQARVEVEQGLQILHLPDPPRSLPGRAGSARGPSRPRNLDQPRARGRAPAAEPAGAEQGRQPEGLPLGRMQMSGSSSVRYAMIPHPFSPLQQVPQHWFWARFAKARWTNSPPELPDIRIPLLFYCFTCDGVFDPQTGTHLAPEEIR